MKPPRKSYRTFSSYEEASEYQREKDVEEYYDDEEEKEEDDMDDFDRWYDEFQDESAIEEFEK